MYIYHHVVPPARISLALSRHFSLSFIASGFSATSRILTELLYVCSSWTSCFFLGHVMVISSCTRPPTSYLLNNPNKTEKACRTMLEKQGPLHKEESALYGHKM